MGYQDKPLRFQYEAAVLMDCTSQHGKTQLHTVELEYDHGLPVDNWQDGKGKFTERGIEALMFAFCSGVTAIIHNAGQINGMDTAKLYRKAISIMDLQFAEQVKITQTETFKPKK